MTLKEELSKKKKGDFIRIGTSNGTGFLYIGTVGDLKFEKLNEDVFTGNVGENKDAPKEAWIPLEDREVVDMYPSSRKTSFIYIIDGEERIKDIGIEWEEVPPEKYHDSGIELLQIAVEKRTAEDYYAALKKQRDTQEAFLEAYQHARRLETLILEGSYVAKNPQSIIDDIRRAVFGDAKC